MAGAARELAGAAVGERELAEIWENGESLFAFHWYEPFGWIFRKCAANVSEAIEFRENFGGRTSGAEESVWQLQNQFFSG